MKNTFQLLSRTLRKGKPYIPIFLLLGGIGLVLAPIELWGLVLSRRLIDQGFLHQNWNIIKQTLFFLCLLFIVRSLITYGTAVLSTRTQLRINQRFQCELFSHLLHLPMKFFTREPTGRLMSRVLEDATRFSEILSRLFGKALLDPLKLLFLTGLLIFFNPSLCMVMIVSAALSFWVIRWTGKRIHVISKELQQQNAEVYSFVEQRFSNIELVKSRTTEHETASDFSRHIDGLIQLALKAANVTFLAQPILQLFTYFALGVIFIYGSWMISEDILTIGTLTVFLGATYLFFNTLNSLGRTYGQLQENLAHMEVLYSILDTPPERSWNKEESKTLSAVNSIEFNNVVFGYNHSTPVLRGVSFSISAGETYGITGQSGSGKTTLMRLLLRFYDSDTGEIILNERPIHQYDLNSLRSSIGIVSQENLILNDTIKNNIAYGLHNISMDQIIQAAEISRAHDFIQSLPDKYETLVGEGGKSLSGGERQRLSIARAMAADPEIVVLDEGTSFLEVEQEGMILQKIKEVRKGKITLIISHRASALRTADRILALDNGRMIELNYQPVQLMKK